jgi:hypothetical protein
MTVSDLLEQPYNKSDNVNMHVQGSYKLLTAFSKLVDNLGQAVWTQLVHGLLADLLQDVGFLRVYRVVVSFSTQKRAAFSSRKGDVGLEKPRPTIWNKIYWDNRINAPPHPQLNVVWKTEKRKFNPIFQHWSWHE